MRGHRPSHLPDRDCVSNDDNEGGVAGITVRYADRSGQAAQPLGSGDITLLSILPMRLPTLSGAIYAEIPPLFGMPFGISIGIRGPGDPPPDPFDPGGHLPGPPPTTNYPSIPIENIPSYSDNPSPDPPLDQLSSILRLGPPRSSNLAHLLIDILRHLGRRSKLRPNQIQPAKLIT